MTKTQISLNFDLFPFMKINTFFYKNQIIETSIPGELLFYSRSRTRVISTFFLVSMHLSLSNPNPNSNLRRWRPGLCCYPPPTLAAPACGGNRRSPFINFISKKIMQSDRFFFAFSVSIVFIRTWSRLKQVLYRIIKNLRNLKASF